MPATDRLLSRLVDWCQRFWDLAFGWPYRCPHCGSEMLLARRAASEEFSLGDTLYTCEQCGIDLTGEFWALSFLND